MRRGALVVVDLLDALAKQRNETVVSASLLASKSPSSMFRQALIEPVLFIETGRWFASRCSNLARPSCVALPCWRYGAFGPSPGFQTLVVSP